MVLSSPKELISCTELSRPTVSGNTACGNSTVSRTGSTGKRPRAFRIVTKFRIGGW